MPSEAGSETLDMSCSDGDLKDCPVESLAFILTAADNRLGSMARKTVDLSEWALIEQQPQVPSKLKVAGSSPAGVARKINDL
jgi:hypothetical protein